MRRVPTSIRMSVIGVAALATIVPVGAAASGRRLALPRYGALPEFSLVDEANRPLRLADLAGSVWVADFIFTRCDGQCPMMSGRMQQLAEAFRDEPAVALVSITVDPAWDTPPVLARYARSFGASNPRWRFATGARETIHRLCRDGFRLASGDGEGDSQEAITHSRRFVLVDRQGAIRGYYDAGEPEAMPTLRRDIHALLQEGL